MIKVAICDDDKQICSKLIAIVKEYFADIGRPVCANSARTVRLF